MAGRPNFFIIGAPKCGTTALATYLREHPNIFLPKEKEPHFFATDLWQFHEYYTKTEADYAALFADVSAEHHAIGEASVFYAYSHTALQNIKAYNPDAKIIMMVRNPIDLVYSLHAQYVYNGFDETESDFERAWALQAERQAGRQLPPKYAGATDRAAEMLQYHSIGRIGEQVERLYSVFSAEQIKVIVFDDFKTDVAEAYQSTLQFLGLPTDGRTNFERINANTERRAAGLRHYAKSLSTNKTAIQAWRKVKRLLGIQSLGIMDKVDSVTTVEVKREALSAELRQRIKQTFQSDIAHLSRQLNRDFSHWS